MAKRILPGWLVDYRFWIIVFIVGFWPAVMLGTYFGLAVLLVVVVGGTIVTQRIDRRARET